MTPNSDTLTRQTVEMLSEYVNKYRGEYMEITKQIMSLRSKQAEMNRKMDEAIEGLAKASGMPKQEWQRLLLGTHFSLFGMSIGDALETIILSEGPQKQKDIIDKMRTEGVKLSQKAPYVVLKNAILRDKRKRFKLLSDGRVDVAGRKTKRQSA